MQETTTYVCLQPVRHNNKPYKPGEKIELTAEDAQGLKECEAIVEPFDGNAVLDIISAAAAEDTEQLTADLVAAKEKIETLNGDLATANSKITQLTADLEIATSRGDQLGESLTKVNNNVVELTGELNTAKTKIGELETDLASEKTKTEKLTSDLATANAAIAAQPKTTTKKTDQAK